MYYNSDKYSLNRGMDYILDGNFGGLRYIVDRGCIEGFDGYPPCLVTALEFVKYKVAKWLIANGANKEKALSIFIDKLNRAESDADIIIYKGEHKVFNRTRCKYRILC